MLQEKIVTQVFYIKPVFFLCANATETFLDMFGDSEYIPYICPFWEKDDLKMSCSQI